ncbi:hypothetical protein MXB_5267, partial [Myxobolus squamalis]
MEGYLDKWNNKTSEFEKKYLVACSKRRCLFFYNNALLSIDDSETTYFTLIINNNLHLRFKGRVHHFTVSLGHYPKKRMDIQNIRYFKNVPTVALNFKKAFSHMIKYIIFLISDKMSSICEPDLQKFSNLLDEVQSDIEELAVKITITLDDVDETSVDLFLECKDEKQPIPVLDDPNDFDSVEYDIESDGHEDELTVNTSVIAYLVSQVKIGMDLSRSCALTNRADKQTSPKERFLAVVKYYLGSFYPGRRFQDNVNGPVPWAKTCDFSFIAEQVSHHPPISAFYAECPQANVSCNAFVHTKSKFMGISVGVHNIGHGILSLNNHNEEYSFSYPSGYARSIFNVPWFEFGGICYLTCAQTCFRAQIEFLCKVNEPDAKKSFAVITGEWNGVMHIKYEGNNNQEVFIDSLHECINRKYVKPIPKQEPDESRLIWQGVTQALKMKDIDKASEFKTK